MFTKKPAPVPTVEERLAAAAAKKGAALSIFEGIERDLMEAEAEAADVALAVEVEIERLRDLARAAWEEQQHAADRRLAVQALTK